jgi:hypothetical protein
MLLCNPVYRDQYFGGGLRGPLFTSRVNERKIKPFKGPQFPYYF